jgi:hypothetical protein
MLLSNRHCVCFAGTCLHSRCLATVATRTTENIALILLRTLPSYDRCLQSHRLVMGLYTTVRWRFQINPFRSSRLEKFRQPGRQGILIPAEPLSELFCSKIWCNKGYKVYFLNCFSVYSITPCTFLFVWCPDCFLRWYHFPHASSKISAKSEL